MDGFGLTKQLILLLERFMQECQNEDVDLAAFLDWAKAQKTFETAHKEYQITGHSLEVEIAAYIGRLSRYSNTYIKKSLEGLPFSTDMEFAFTAILDGAGQVGKTDLIRMMAYDKSSGMGVIKRLIANGIIEEFPNPDDKRGKLLRLTAKGKENVQLGYQKAPKAAHLISKPFTTIEKRRLVHLLKKLDDFHYPMYLNEKQDIDELN